jgi:hypothetical protein
MDIKSRTSSPTQGVEQHTKSKPKRKKKTNKKQSADASRMDGVHAEASGTTVQSPAAMLQQPAGQTNAQSPDTQAASYIPSHLPAAARPLAPSGVPGLPPSATGAAALLETVKPSAQSTPGDYVAYHKTMRRVSARVDEALTHGIALLRSKTKATERLVETIVAQARTYSTFALPTNEADAARHDTYCANMLRDVTKLPYPLQYLFYDGMKNYISHDPVLSSLGANPVAQTYLALIFLHHEDAALKSSALAHLRANYGVIATYYAVNGETVSPQVSAPWWNSSMCPTPLPDPDAFAADTSHAGLLIEVEQAEQEKLAKLGDAEQLASRKSFAHFKHAQWRFLLTHADALQVTRELTQWMAQDPTLLLHTIREATAHEAAYTLLPSQSLDHLQELQTILHEARLAGHSYPAEEAQCAKLQERLQEMDTASKVRYDLTSQLVYLMRNDQELMRLNEKTHVLGSSIKSKSPVKSVVAKLEKNKLRAAEDKAKAQRLESDAQRAKLEAELIAWDQEQGAARKTSASTSKKSKGKKSNSKNKSPAQRIQVEAAEKSGPSLPPASVAPAVAEPEGFGLHDLTLDANYTAVKGKRSAEVPVWRETLNAFAADPAVRTPQQMHELFQQILLQVDVRNRMPAYVDVEGFRFYTRLGSSALAALLPVVFDAGTFSGPTPGSRVAASVAYHYKKHVLNRPDRWPGPRPVTVEHYIEQGLLLATRPDYSTPPRARVDKPSLSAVKRWRNDFFGLYSDRSLILSYGPREDLSASATAAWAGAVK